MPVLVQCHRPELSYHYCPPGPNVCCATRQTRTSANFGGFFKDNLLLPLKKKKKKPPELEEWKAQLSGHQLLRLCSGCYSADSHHNKSYWCSSQKPVPCSLTNVWTLRGYSENWYQASPSCIDTVEFPRTLMENFSSCCNKSYPSWRDHWPALTERRLDLTILFESTALGSVLLFLSSLVEMQCWCMQNTCKREKRLNLCEYPATPLQSDDEYFMGRFQNCSFPFYIFSSRGGICGRGVFSISVLGTYFLWPAICPVYVCSLTCLSLLSTVEKRRHTQKRTNNPTRQNKKNTKKHAPNTDCPLQYNLVV